MDSLTAVMDIEIKQQINSLDDTEKLIFLALEYNLKTTNEIYSDYSVMCDKAKLSPVKKISFWKKYTSLVKKVNLINIIETSTGRGGKTKQLSLREGFGKDTFNESKRELLKEFELIENEDENES